MRKIREVLRLKFELDLDNRQIARSCSIPHSSVANYLSRVKTAGLSWPLPPDLSDSDLESRLFPAGPVRQDVPLPAFAAMHNELVHHKHLTLELLWQEYKWRNNQSHGPISSLRYFESILEEIAGQKIDPGYWGFLRFRMPRHEQL